MDRIDIIRKVAKSLKISYMRRNTMHDEVSIKLNSILNSREIEEMERIFYAIDESGFKVVEK